MGQAPATGRNSLRTVPRNFPGRSGTREDAVFLCSPETAAASALNGRITDPRDLDMAYPDAGAPVDTVVDTGTLTAPLPEEQALEVELRKSPNIASLPQFDALPGTLELPVLLKVRDDLSTDEIMPAGARVLPFRSNIPRISDFCFERVDDSYPQRAAAVRDAGGHVIVGGDNYGQGSSREHAAIAPRHLGLRAVVAKGFARIHRQNLINFGVLPLTFASDDGYDAVAQDDVLVIEDLPGQLEAEGEVSASLRDKNRELSLRHDLSSREIEVLLAGGLINWKRDREAA